MPKLFDHNGTTSTEIKKIYDHNGTAATQIKKAYDHNGTTSTLVYSLNTAVTLNNLSIASGALYNYTEYNQARYAVSSGSWNLSSYTSLVLSVTGTVTNMWSNERGATATVQIGIQLNDGTRVALVSESSGALYTAGQSVTKTGSRTISLSGYTTSQKSAVKLYAMIGAMTQYDGSTGMRFDMTAASTSAIASN